MPTDFGYLSSPPEYGYSRPRTYEDILHKSNQQALNFVSIVTSAILGSSGPPKISYGTVRTLSNIAGNPAVLAAVVGSVASFMTSKSKGDVGKYPLSLILASDSCRAIRIG